MSKFTVFDDLVSLENDTAIALDPEYSSQGSELWDICEHYNSPVSRKDRIEFSLLVTQWEQETSLYSSLDKICMHPAYQRIIGVGEKILPLIFSELERNPAHWFWALSAITGENPIQPDQRGNLRKMTRAWLDWANSHGY